jgi:hypothetical protein
MNYNNTICHKVDTAMHSLEDYVKGGRIEPEKLARLLRSIQHDAIAMEDGLKERKKAMIEAGVEEKYQTAKGNKKPEGINKIAGIRETRPEKDLNFEVTVRDLSKEGEIVYKGKSHAGVVSTVDEIEKLFDYEGVTHGKTQTFYWGNPLAWLFAFHQLERSITPHFIEVNEWVKTHHPEFFENNNAQKRAIDIALKKIGRM